jgi:multicomponent Na+:H+ antiporter subunit A
MDNILSLLIGLIFLAGLATPLLYRIWQKNTGIYLSVIPLIIFVVLISELIQLVPRESSLLETTMGFLPGMEFAFRIDGLSLIFGLLISGIGVLILLHASYYMAKYERQANFYTYLMFFMGAMIGMVFSDNLLVLFIFWEITSVASFFLIGFDHHAEKSRQAALQALLITGFGGLCLFFAVILTGNITGTYVISELLEQNIHLGNHPQYYLILTLTLLAAITKSAQFPFHFWLPGAMQAPTPVSAYLHSATMVNAGIFLLMRIYPIMGGTMMWKYSLMLTGVITMFLGAFFAMGQRDFKRILAFTTISALGTMTLLVGIDTPDSLKAALVFFIVHGLYKGGLFMVAGIIDKSTGTRDIYDLHGLYKKMPITTIVTLLALISMAGLPPMLGFIGKELIYEAKMQLPDVSWLLLPLGVGANMLMVAISITVFYELFVPDKKRKPVVFKYLEKELPLRFVLGPILLAVVGLFLGLNPKILEMPVDNGLYFMGNQLAEIYFSLWHGFNDVLILSIFTVLSGIFIFFIRRPVTRMIARIITWMDHLHLPTLFTQLINKYLKTAAKNTNLLQHGYHRFYLMTFFLVVIALMGIQIFRITDIQLPELTPSPIKIHVALLLLVTAISVIFAVFAKSRLSAILAMGVVGYGIAMLYLYYGAVDLAITQFLAETVLMVLFVMVIYYLPEFAILSNKKSRLRDGIISVAVGVFVTLVVLKAKFLNLETPISEFFAANSYTEAHGRNIVNVILVDFRALDTMGELTVLTLAAAGVYSLFRFQIKTLKHKKLGKKTSEEKNTKKMHK